MLAHQGELRHTVVYGRTGQALVERVQVPSPPDRPLAPLRGDAEVRVQHVMSNDLICAYEDIEIPALTALIVRHRIGCIPIVDRMGRAIGMVTKTDLVEHLDVTHRKETSRASTARDIMMPLAMVLSENAHPLEAATLMVLEDIHHVMVVSEGGFLVGVVSTKDLVRWMVDR